MTHDEGLEPSPPIIFPVPLLQAHNVGKVKLTTVPESNLVEGWRAGMVRGGLAG